MQLITDPKRFFAGIDVQLGQQAGILSAVLRIVVHALLSRRHRGGYIRSHERRNGPVQTNAWDSKQIWDRLQVWFCA